MNPELVYDIALTLQPKIGPRTAAYLLSIFGEAKHIFNAPKDELITRAELNPNIAASIQKKELFKQAESELQYCQRHNITPIVSTSDLYPSLLKECDDYPHVIYFRGNLEILHKRMISMVGTRKISSYGSKVCNKIIGDLSQCLNDLVIVSGLAYGVDAASHRAALSNNLPTIAVLPCALPGVYPATHTTLAEEIIRKGGGLLTEYHSNSKNNGNNFIPRNRIIAGISEGTILVESPMRGGALVTANMADGYHRCVMAIPGRVGDMCSEGTNYMIKENKARMVCSAEDIIKELMWDVSSPAQKQSYEASILSEGSKKLLSAIPDGESISIDHLAEKSGLSISEISTLIFELECDGLIRMLPGKRYEKS